MSRQTKAQKIVDLESQLRQLYSLLQEVEQEIAFQESQDKVAPPGTWIVRYQTRGNKSSYWYYKWQSKEPIFITKDGQKTRNKYIGKASSRLFVEAVEMMENRAKIDSLAQVRQIIELALLDLIEEAIKNQDDV